MGDNTKIEWTDATWNPITGCSVVSPGCTNCYAMKLAGTRLRNHPTRAGLTRETKAGPVWNGEVRFNDKQLREPLGWKRPRMIFVCAHGDLFHESVPDSWIDQVFAVMALCPQHTFQVLTKRPDRMREYVENAFERVFREMMELVEFGVAPVRVTMERHGMPWTPPTSRDDWWPLRNVWLGTSVEDQRRADERISHLLDTPAAVRFLSAEPLLGPIDLRAFGLAVHHHPDNQDSPHLRALVRAARQQMSDGRVIDWVIAGGESGPGARPMHPDWARALRDQCQAAGVPFFFKQWGNWLGGRYFLDLDDWLGFENLEGQVLPLTRSDDQHHWDEAAVPEGIGSLRMTKAAAGRLLDGIEHNGMPERR